MIVALRGWTSPVLDCLTIDGGEYKTIIPLSPSAPAYVEREGGALT